MSLDVSAILGPGGLIARRLPHYEHREQQLQMAEAVADALSRSKHLVVEAGTGVGKSFAYLVPAILHATADQGADSSDDEDDDEQDGEAAASRKIVVSTHTISLQEQLIDKDLPLLNSVIPREFTSVLVKGRGNYISLRRFDLARTRAANMLDETESIQLERLRAWLRETNDGSLSSLAFRPRPSLWDEIASDSSNCLGKKCKTYDQCHYYRARRRIQGAQVLVVNHALFFTDLAVRKQAGFGILPDYHAAILDECHTVESVASAYLGIKVTNGQLLYTLNKLYNPSTGKGLFVALGLDRVTEEVNRVHMLVDQLVFDLDEWMTREGTAKRVREKGIVPNLLSDPLLELSKKLSNLADNASDASRRQDLLSAASRLEGLGLNLRAWLNQTDDQLVYWLERTFSRLGEVRMEMHAAPMDISGHMREMLFQEVPCVVMASATVSTGREGGFEFFQSRVGATGSETAKLGSPFDYRKQAKLIVVGDMPDPSSDRQAYEAALPDMIQRYLLQTGGHAFVLFTSYGLLRSTARKMQTWLAQQNLSLYSQADGAPRGQLLEQFKRNPRGALFGTDSFWQGVDVPGDALGNVIITKLPFSVPDHPLLQARLELIRQAGGNPFTDYQLPEAVIKLRQGFGRLIRTANDSGIVVILDSRVKTKYYGRTFLASLPECEVLEQSCKA
ncbi:MAG: helicase [Planctomycetales bacterium]|nr:helicase [Planctomycetales bacterium]